MLTNTDNMIDIRDVIARIEALQETTDATEREELTQLCALMDECEGQGGDEEYDGDWYPVTLIHEDYFEEYMDELVADCYTLPKDLPSWMSITYDYDALRQDYTYVDFNGQAYLTR